MRGKEGNEKERKTEFQAHRFAMMKSEM